jgi:hypothetical protein
MTVDACYCTYRKDLQWIKYSLNLLLKHFQSPLERVQVVIEENCRDLIRHWQFPDKVIFHFIQPWVDGYHHAMYRKLVMDTLSEADLLMLLDSDHMLMRPTSLEDVMQDGKPIIYYRHWEDYPDAPDMQIAKAQWGPPTEACMGVPLEVDYMSGPPFLFWRNTFPAVRKRIEEVTGKSLHEVCYSDTPYDYTRFLSHPKRFCDYECLGLYGAKFEPERYVLKHLPRDHNNPFRVYWSHGDWTLSLQNKLDALLAA